MYISFVNFLLIIKSYVAYGMIAPHVTMGRMFMNMFSDLENAELIVVWGTNPATDLPPIDMQRILQARERGAEVVVPAVEPMTTVRIHQKNTDKLIVAEVPVKHGRYDETGDYAISGVPGTGGKITLRFSDPGGAVTGRLLPTGNTRDTLEVPGLGSVEVTIIDAANPVVLVPATQIGLLGTEIDEIDGSTDIKDKLEAIRCAAAVVIGIAKSPQEATRSSQAVPKIACISAPQPYNASNGKRVKVETIDLTIRIMSMGTLHRSIAVSGAIAAAGAAMIEETVAFKLKNKSSTGGTIINLGHPGGIVDVVAKIDMENGEPHYVEAAVGRTARRLMEGYVLVPERIFR